MPAAAPPEVAAPLRWTAEGHLAACDRGVELRFTTRRGGASAAPWDSLDLGPWGTDDPVDVAANRATVAAWAGAGAAELAQPRQVHGVRVLRLAAADRRPGPDHEVEADGVCTAAPGLPTLVVSADCLPVVLVVDGAFACVHAGWRGLADGVLEAAVAALAEAAGAGGITAWLGPAAGVCCYEVGPEVHAAFAELGPTVRDGDHLDLVAAASLRLGAAGVATIHAAGLCTICRPELFFSHRRDGVPTGRQGAIAWRT